MTRPEAPPRGHLPSLDGLRGLAVLGVLAFHFVHLGGLERHPLDRALVAAAGAGWAGVDLFFVLSGFLITGILLDARGAGGYFRVFYARRALRIFPLYLASLAALFLVAPLLGGERVDGRTQAFFWGWSANVLYALRGTFDGPPALAAHFWSLAVEEQFYLLWPLAVWLLPRRGVAWASLAMVAGAALLRAALLAGAPNATAAYVLTPCRMDALAAGALVAVAVREPGGLPLLRRWAPATSALAVAALAVLAGSRGALFGGDPAVQRWGFTPLALLFAALLVTALAAPGGSRLRRALEWGPLRAAGRYSYALYVLHYPIFRLLEARGFSAADVPPVAGSRLPGLALFAAAAGGASVGAALLSWHLLERRFLAWKERFRYSSPVRAAAPGALPAP